MGHQSFIDNNRNDSPVCEEDKKEAEGQNILTGRWTNHEHELFLTCNFKYLIELINFREILIYLWIGLKKHGKDWKFLETWVPTRTGVQVRSHAQNYIDNIKREWGVMDPVEYIQKQNSKGTQPYRYFSEFRPIFLVRIFLISQIFSKFPTNIYFQDFSQNHLNLQKSQNFQKYQIFIISSRKEPRPTHRPQTSSKRLLPLQTPKHSQKPEKS